MPIRNSSRVAVAMFSLTFALSPVAAQKKTGGQDPSEKPRNVKPELKKAYKDWLEKDVTYIITDEERKAFKKLETDDERPSYRCQDDDTAAEGQAIQFLARTPGAGAF